MREAEDKQQVEPGKFNLIATYGSGPGGLVLAGHSDTVPFDEALWQSDPLKLTDTGDRGVGLGVCDMKGFFALIIEAVQTRADMRGQGIGAAMIGYATEEARRRGCRTDRPSRGPAACPRGPCRGR